MMRCHTCHNEYDDLIEITMSGKTYHFDCFECAIHALAPRCEVCEVRIIGHGYEAGESMFCSAHCAKEAGHGGVSGHIEPDRSVPAQR